jgi:uncharacterized protein (DUF1330 family)
MTPLAVCRAVHAMTGTIVKRRSHTRASRLSTVASFAVDNTREAFRLDKRCAGTSYTTRGGLRWEHRAVTAYVISEVEILDESEGQRYRELASASIAQYGGRYIVRGAAPEVPEGDWPSSQRVVVVEFPTMERLRCWYNSPEYAEALAVRQTALSRRLLFVEGVSGTAAE